jgi:Kelch motif
MTASTRSALLLALGLALVASGCGGASSPATSSHAAHKPSTPRAAVAPRPLRLTYRRLFALPAPLRDSATAALGGSRFVLLGGLNAADTSADGVEVLDLQHVVASAVLPQPQHDAQGAALGGNVYVFGGGDLTELDHIVRFDPAQRTVSTVGQLPRASSDVGVTEVGGTAYIVGGYDGTSWLNTILAWRPGSPVRVAGHLPVGLRYAGVTAVGGDVLIIGGSTPVAASRDIFRFDPSTGHVRKIGRLPQALTHLSAATLGAYAYAVGGRGDLTTAQTAGVWSIDPRTGAVRPAGRLPEPLSDADVLTVGNGIVVAGGLTSSGTVAGVGELVPAR